MSQNENSVRCVVCEGEVGVDGTVRKYVVGRHSEPEALNQQMTVSSYGEFEYYKYHVCRNCIKRDERKDTITAGIFFGVGTIIVLFTYSFIQGSSILGYFFYGVGVLLVSLIVAGVVTSIGPFLNLDDILPKKAEQQYKKKIFDASKEIPDIKVYTEKQFEKEQRKAPEQREKPKVTSSPSAQATQEQHVDVSPELEYKETTTEEIEIKESDWIAYYGFFRGRDENADSFFETLLGWSKNNPPPATFILCRFDTDGANYVHYVGCIANRADCSKLSLWVGNDFYRYQQETGTPSEFAKDSGTAPLPQLMTEEMVVDMIDESRFEVIRSI